MHYKFNKAIRTAYEFSPAKPAYDLLASTRPRTTANIATGIPNGHKSTLF
ncbi:unnamed protein product, partial [Acanthoscelides obtectus]